MRHYRWLPFFLLLACMTGLLPMRADVFAATQSAAYVPGGIPLVVIRFNQDRVYYERPLYNAIARAVEIKPSVMFHLVSYAPLTRNAKKNKVYRAEATTELQKLINSLQKMGIPQSRINTVREDANDIQHHEVHIYVD